MEEEIAFKNGQISNFESLAVCILHTVVRHSWTSTDMPNFIEIEESFCERTNVCMYVSTYARTNGHLRPALLARLCHRVDLNIHSRLLYFIIMVTSFRTKKISQLFSDFFSNIYPKVTVLTLTFP